ncbi:hypothetical protein BV210_05855 [Halorientalis sp. IM1011]|uniref:DUF4350 domain-containing protein n=1 Tax=Halorientalis sp. IM1011 TaxID=1932360 RepID=UPI00097CCA8B|nr:DUF4350 domain-containing protein [Halorientalis sp. IM1011]AQL42266.1 hypothetical protein BV210_05855 [Halorientalis sp. IM1011]
MSTPWYRLGLAVFAVVVATAVVFAGSTSTAAYAPHNPSWDGTSELRAQTESAGAEWDLARATAAYGSVDPDGTVAVVLSPDREYGTDEAAAVRSFVRDGGTLVVAEDYGSNGNELLDAVNASARVDGRSLRDERNYYRSPALVDATNVSDELAADGVESLTLNHGTAVHPNGSTVLVATSPYGYLDGNQNGELDDSESLRSHPVATSESVGEGRVVVVGDPSVFINAMQEREGNSAFVRTLVDEDDRVLVDISHGEPVPPLAMAVLVLRETPLAQLLVGTSAIFALAVWTTRPSLLERGRTRLARLRGHRPAFEDDGVVSREAVLEHVAARHPEWDRDRVERLVDTDLDASPGDRDD